MVIFFFPYKTPLFLVDLYFFFFLVFFRCLFLNDENAQTVTECEDPNYNATDPDCKVKVTTTITITRAPAQKDPIMDKLGGFISSMMRAVGDLEKVWTLVLGVGGGFALLFSGFWLFFLKYFAGCMVWSVCYGVLLMMIFASIFFSVKGGLIGEFWSFPPPLFILKKIVSFTKKTCLC